MLFGGQLLLVSVCIAAAHPFAKPEDDPVTVVQLNRLVDAVLSEVLKGPIHTLMDPLLFPDQFRAVEHGTYRMTEATATGLSILFRLGDASYVHADDEPDDLIVTATLATNTVLVRARLMARTNAGDISHGKVQGVLEPVKVGLQLRMPKGQRATLISFNVVSHLHPVAEKYDGKTDGDEIMSIVRDALDYGFSFVYGDEIQKIVEGALHQEIARVFSTINYTIRTDF